MNPDARFLSVKILNRFEKKNEQLSLIRNQVFSQFDPDLLSKSRSMALTNEVVRIKDRLDLTIQHISGRKIARLDPSLLSILRVGFYEILYDETVPDYAAVDSAVKLTKSILNRKASGLTNAVLRTLIRTMEKDSDWDRELQSDPTWHSIPQWLQKRWIAQFGENGFSELAKKFNKTPITFIRGDLSQQSREDIQKQLEELDIKSEVYSDSFLKIKSGSGKILFTNLFQSGQISIQDPAAGSVVEFLEPQNGETILDVCAAPGTKSLYLAEKVGNSGKVLASDYDKIRVNRGKKDVNRHQRKNIEWSLMDATKDDFPMADKILIDAPCTGTGVMGRKPDIRWRRKPQDITDMANLQFKMLNHVSQFLYPGGTLVYATCSLEPEENWNVVEQFLKLNADFQLQTGSSCLPKAWIDEQGCFQTLPHVHGVDGMFAAKITRS